MFLHKESKTLEAFEKNEGYPGWIPDFGSQCRGARLPPSSNLTYVNSLSRQAFEDISFGMDFYGRTWKFSKPMVVANGGAWYIRSRRCTL
jgi:hypothetical protein